MWLLNYLVLAALTLAFATLIGLLLVDIANTCGVFQ